MNAKELIERFDKSCYRPQVNLLGKIGSIITEAAKPPGRQDALEHIKSNLRTQITLMEGLLSRANDEYVNIKNTKDEFQKWICRLQTIDGAVASQLIDYFDQINEGSMHLKKKARDMLIYFDDSIHPDAKEIINKLLNFFQ